MEFPQTNENDTKSDENTSLENIDWNNLPGKLDYVQNWNAEKSNQLEQAIRKWFTDKGCEWKVEEKTEDRVEKTEAVADTQN